MAMRFTTTVALIGLAYGQAAAQEVDPTAVVRALEQATATAVERSEGSVVSLSVVTEGPATGGPFRLSPRMGGDVPDWREMFGTGVILARPGDADHRFVLTNRHVITAAANSRGDGRPRLVAILPGPIQVPAEVIASDPRSDLAVLQLDLESKGLAAAEAAAIEIGEAESFRKGRLVVTLGNPYAVARDGSASVGLGTIANISRSPWNGARRFSADQELTLHHLGTLWHLDARLQLGSSGGAVVDFQGRLIGITTSLAALDGYESSVGYAIPLTAGFRRIVDSLLQGYEVEYGFLGIAPRSSRRLGAVEGGFGVAAQVASVATGSPADQAGIRPDDFITSVNGIGIRNEDDLIREIGLLGPDAVARVELRRGSPVGPAETVEVRLGKWPVYDDTTLVATRRRHDDWRGLRVDYPTSRRRYIPSDIFDRYPQAVVITAVAPDSPAAAAGLREGEFIARVGDRRVLTPSEFAEAIKNRSGPQTLTMEDGRELTISE